MVNSDKGEETVNGEEGKKETVSKYPSILKRRKALCYREASSLLSL